MRYTITVSQRKLRVENYINLRDVIICDEYVDDIGTMVVLISYITGSYGEITHIRMGYPQSIDIEWQKGRMLKSHNLIRVHYRIYPTDLNIIILGEVPNLQQNP